MKPGGLGGDLPTLASTLGRPRGSAPVIDKYTIVSISACVLVLIVAPLLIVIPSFDFQTLDTRPENRIFWPAMAAVSVALALQNRFLAFVDLLCLPTSSVSSRILRLLEQASCGRSDRRAHSLDLFSK